MDYEIKSTKDNCPICLENDIILISPKEYKEVKCSHFICEECWCKVGKVKPLCPFCQENVMEWIMRIRKFEDDPIPRHISSDIWMNYRSSHPHRSFGTFRPLKITANSLYGRMGFRMPAILFMPREKPLMPIEDSLALNRYRAPGSSYSRGVISSGKDDLLDKIPKMADAMLWILSNEYKQHYRVPENKSQPSIADID